MPRILTATGPAASPSAGLTFQNIETRDNEVDRLMAPDSFGGFSSLGHFCRTAARVQMTKGALGDTTDRDIWRSWINAYSRYHNHLADIERGRRTRTDIVRAITTPDGMFETSEPDGGALVPPGFVREVFFKAMYRVTPFSTCKIVPVMSNAVRSRRSPRRAAWMAADGEGFRVSGRGRPSQEPRPGPGCSTRIID